MVYHWITRSRSFNTALVKSCDCLRNQSATEETPFPQGYSVLVTALHQELSQSPSVYKTLNGDYKANTAHRQSERQESEDSTRARMEAGKVTHAHPAHHNLLKNGSCWDTSLTSSEKQLSNLGSASNIYPDPMPAGNSQFSLGGAHLNISLAHMDSYLISSQQKQKNYHGRVLKHNQAINLTPTHWNGCNEPSSGLKSLS